MDSTDGVLNKKYLPLINCYNLEKLLRLRNTYLAPSILCYKIPLGILQKINYLLIPQGHFINTAEFTFAPPLLAPGVNCALDRDQVVSVPFLSLQGWAKVSFPGLLNFVPAVAYHFCLNLPAAFSQPGNGNLLHPCISLPVPLPSLLHLSSDDCQQRPMCFLT